MGSRDKESRSWSIKSQSGEQTGWHNAHTMQWELNKKWLSCPAYDAEHAEVMILWNVKTLNVLWNIAMILSELLIYFLSITIQVQFKDN